ncbi:hypothetical protein KC361_g8881 [Hortaea werneckii]|nr:hypothetical protein KC361_g8881 [Hortaea werneckii]
MEYKAKVVAARERKFPWRNFEPISWSCCYDVELDVPIFGLPFDWIEKTPWLEFELACKSETTNGCLQQWRSMLPIKVITSGYSSSYEMNEGTRNDSTQDDHEEPPVSNGCSSSHEMDEVTRKDFTPDDHEEPPVDGYFRNADPMPLRIKPADMTA